MTRSLELRAAPGSWANRAVEASSAYTAERPYTVPDDWDADGWAIDVSYADLAQPIGRDEISFEWRRDHAEAPFDRHGKVKQGYLFPVSDGLAAVVFQDFADRWPPIPPPAADSALPDAHQLLVGLVGTLRAMPIPMKSSNARCRRDGAPTGRGRSSPGPALPRREHHG